MRSIGTLTKWNDERGFGFITPNQAGDEIFVHISAFPRDGIRPIISETVSFEVAVHEGKPRAVSIQRPSGNRKRANRTAHRTEGGRRTGNKLFETLIAVAVIGFAGYVGYTRSGKSTINMGTPEASPEFMNLRQEATTPKFTCDGREHCSEMRSYEEAKFFINNCPNTKMDGDRDGEPCEDQF